LESDLRLAISDGQFELQYQPLINLADGTISCCEALVRWHHPTRGTLPPSEFIAIAEGCGSIVPIGEWVLRESCREAASWPGDVSVAVNLSPAQFKRSNLNAMIVSALAAANLDPGRLELEITEAVLLDDEDWIRSVLEGVTSLGVRIAMDDFGTGYSSLRYLRSFPFSKIKIDQSFVADLEGGGDALAIVQATIQLSKKLGLTTTAEGVETNEQLRILADEGCTQAQGFLISPPVQAAEIPALLALHNHQTSPRRWAAG
jgi:EAL domain-containing protein (putative c-di-GMP-specific phosphodiesterase class I)